MAIKQATLDIKLNLTKTRLPKTRFAELHIVILPYLKLKTKF
jgi:hypothetical protein